MTSTDLVGRAWATAARFVTFLDLRIQQKVLLFSAGTTFWFLVMAAVAIGSQVALQGHYRRIVVEAIPQQRLAAEIAAQVEAVGREGLRLLQAEPATVRGIEERGRARLEDLVGALSFAPGAGAAHGGGASGSRESGLAALLDDPETGGAATRLAERVRTFAAAHAALARAVRGVEGGAAGVEAALGDARQGFERAFADAGATARALGARIARRTGALAAEADRAGRIAVALVLAILVVEVVLLTVFSRLIAASIIRPTSAIRRQIRALSEGEAELTEKVPVMSRDEIGRLTEEFNELTATVYDMTTFKRVIEDDDSVEDVYARLGRVFRDKVGIEEVAIIEVSHDQRGMVCVYPPEGAGGGPPCDEAIYLECELCRVRKTGHRVSSLEFPRVCPQYTGGAEREHVCLPLSIGGRTGAVMQFLFPPPGADEAARERINSRVFKAEAYVRQSLSVIEAKQLLRTLRDSAVKDSLTGLFNRRFLQEHADHLIQGAQRRGKSIGLLMCDLDYFKQVNDQYGHDAGDRVLRETAHAIRDSVRDADVVIRFGGEEFLVLLVDIEPGDALEVAEKIRGNVSATKVRLNGETMSKNISIGVSEFPGDTQAFWHAIKFADVALYEAKRGGRDRAVRFEQRMWQEESF